MTTVARTHEKQKKNK